MRKEQFEEACRSKGLVPIARIDTQYGNVLVAESFKHDKPDEFGFGYYWQMWAVERDGMDIAKEVLFDAFHDPHLPLDYKQQARTNATLRDAEGWLALNVRDSGRYDK